MGATIFLSCHKSSTPVDSNCSISAINVTGDFTANYKLSYDGSGRLSVVKYTDDGGSWTRNFTYGANLIVSSKTGPSPAVDSVYLNASGDVDHIVDRQPPNSVTTTTMTYNSSHQLSQTVVQAGGSMPSTTTYQYTNGDLTQVDQDGSIIVYTYYTDKASATGGMMELQQWLQFGVIYQKSAHLVKAYGYTNPDEQVSYVYDGSGKISSMTGGNGSSLLTFSYTYDCH